MTDAPRTTPLHRVLATLVAGLMTFSVTPHADAAKKTALVGLFKIQAGGFSGSTVHGSYFRMLEPDGKTYLANTSSAAHAKYTLLKPGTDGGLRTGVYQKHATPAFASNGNALSGRITAPVKFYGVKFATSTNKTDPQTGLTTTLPTIYATGSSLSGDLRAFAAQWNKQSFNQGSPKPNGSTPGITKAVSGTYNRTTKVYTITWRSKIVGGPFNRFTGEWHLTGTFVAKSSGRSSSVRSSFARGSSAPALASAAGLIGFGVVSRRRLKP